MTLRSPDDITDTFVDLASVDCTLNGQYIDLREE